MSTPPLIAFDSLRTDVVTAVLIPIDGLTRRPVRDRLDARLWDPERRAPLPNRLIRNLSGHVVLTNESADQELTFRLDPTAAGYRGPLFVTLNPARDGVTRVVALERRPNAGFDDTATLVRGEVVRTADPASPIAPLRVAGLTVAATPAARRAGHQFPATTDERGVFALVVGLRVPATDEAAAAVRTVLRFEKAGFPVRELTVDLNPGRTHIFATAVDLDRADQPHFTTNSGRSTWP